MLLPGAVKIVNLTDYFSPLSLRNPYIIEVHTSTFDSSKTSCIFSLILYKKIQAPNLITLMAGE
jgi:hypothetical protein